MKRITGLFPCNFVHMGDIILILGFTQGYRKVTGIFER